ncbi:MAG: hypothetical protein QOD32_3706 [Pyrinomonadaceae bacterium]|jgi:hypothetical protein|nr:hypothetical protein [Pyrinomonadaceae bacterium]
MSSNRSINEPTSEPHLFEGGEETPSKWVKIGAIVCALAVAAALLVGYRFLHARQLARVRAAQQAEQVAKIAAPPEAQILEDEARLRGSQALITGTVRNISDKRLEALSLEMELKRRGNPQAAERRKINVEPGDLAPGEEGHYSLSLLSSEWSGARVLSLNSERRAETIAFKSAVGARRPAERLPQGNPKIVVVPRPRPKGEEFINTPDNPTRVP